MAPPLVSVVIPAYNCEEFIGEAIESVLHQSFDDYEILIVDDGSSDGTKTVSSQYVGDKVQYYYQENSGCASSPRNFGIEKSTGKYVALLDADDLWETFHLERSLAFLEKSSREMLCFSNFIQFGEQAPYPGKNWFELPHVSKYLNQVAHIERVDGAIHMFDPGSVYTALLQSNFIQTCSVVCHRSLFEKYGNFRTDLTSAEDRELWLRFAKNQVPFTAIELPSVRYRIQSGSLSRNTRTIKSRLRFWKMMATRPHNGRDNGIIKQNIAKQYQTLSYNEQNYLLKILYRIKAKIAS